MGVKHDSQRWAGPGAGYPLTWIQKQCSPGCHNTTGTAGCGLHLLQDQVMHLWCVSPLGAVESVYLVLLRGCLKLISALSARLITGASTSLLVSRSSMQPALLRLAY